MISHQQLVELGWSRRRIGRARGIWLHPQFRGVYSLGTRRVTHRGRVWGALLAFGAAAERHPHVPPRERTLNEAHYLHLFTPWQIPEVIAAHRGWKGTRALRAIYEDGGFGVTQEELERIFKKLLRAHGLPLPETNVPIRLGSRVIHPDCVWRDAKLIIELDGGAAHRTTSRFHGDRRRDRKLDMNGWTVWRVTWHDLHVEPDDLIADLRVRLGC